jgi:UDP-N-acetylglucosamine transferase subunit ALG13
LSTFVSVGNLKKPFVRMLQAVSDNAAILPGPVIVQHGHSPFHDPNCTAVPFLKMEEFQQRVAGAELVILHGGAGSIITALQAGKRPIVMARSANLGEHVDEHQQELVRELSAAGRIIVAVDAASLREAVEHAWAASHSGGSASSRRRTRMEELVASDLESWATHVKEHR